MQVELHPEARVEIRFLKDDLLRRRGTDDFRQVALMRGVPIGPTHIVHAEAQQERVQSPRRVRHGEAGRVAGAAAIAKRFVVDGRDVDRREIPRTESSREFDRVASVLTLSPGFFGMRDGATTWQANPWPVRSRYRP